MKLLKFNLIFIPFLALSLGNRRVASSEGQLIL